MIHILKGLNGWSKLNISSIDINKIKNINYKKRLFTIFDTNYPYTLTIEYNEPLYHYGIAPGYGLYGPSIIVNHVYLTQYITKRYATEIEIQIEIKEIKNKQNKK